MTMKELNDGLDKLLEIERTMILRAEILNEAAQKNDYTAVGVWAESITKLKKERFSLAHELGVFHLLK